MRSAIFCRDCWRRRGPEPAPGGAGYAYWERPA